MDKSQIASIIIEQNKNNEGAIPITLSIDNEDIAIDLTKNSGIVFMGVNAQNRINNLISQLSNYEIVSLNDATQLSSQYDELQSLICINPQFLSNQPKIIVINDVEKLSTVSQQSFIQLVEILRKGHGVKWFFICATSTLSLDDKIAINFSVKIREEYASSQASNFNAVFDYIGKQQRIKLQ